MPADRILPPKSISVHRRSNKPIMEKKRRARINNCLNELKNLLLEAMRKDPARHSKLEKADILEMTVKHLQTLQRQQVALTMVADPSVVTKYRAGFNECADEVSRYVSRVAGIGPDAKQRLLNHLANCLNGLSVMMTSSKCIASGPNNNMSASSTISALAAAVANSTATSTLTGGGETSVRLIPSRLPSGEIAFLLPRQDISKWPKMTSDLPFLSRFQTGTAESAICDRTYKQNPSLVVSSTSQASYSSPPSSLSISCSSPSTSSSSVSDDDQGYVTVSGVHSPSCCSSSSYSPVLSDDSSDAIRCGGHPATTSGQFHRNASSQESDRCESSSADQEMQQQQDTVSQQLHPRNAEVLLPVDLSKDAERMWRPW